MEKFLANQTSMNSDIMQRTIRTLKTSFDGYSPVISCGPFTSIFRAGKYVDLTKTAIKSLNATQMNIGCNKGNTGCVQEKTESLSEK